MSFRPQALLTRIQAVFGEDPPRDWCVALSGGLDSTVLLHALSAVLDRRQGVRLRALHVHHGLYPDADAWTEAARAQAQAVGCAFGELRVQVSREGGQSLEDCARRARYQALAGAMAPGELLLTAHHQDDQLETVLLQLMRGAGVAGLAAMPELAPLGPGQHFRPLLSVPRRQLADWAVARGLDWVEEPGNLDTRFDRNYLRHRVLPVLQDRWPSAARAAARSASHCAEAMTLLAQMAAGDQARCARGPDLSTRELLSLDEPRLKNLLRAWLAEAGLPTPPSHVLALVREQVLLARPQAQPHLAWPGGELRRYRGRLVCQAPLEAIPVEARLPWSPGSPLVLPGSLGQLVLAPGSGPGPHLRRAGLSEASLEVGFRQGGERLRLPGRQGSHGLRDLFQEQGVLPWVRDRIPLLYADGRLAAVGSLWVAAEWAAGPADEGVTLRWEGAPRLVL